MTTNSADIGSAVNVNRVWVQPAQCRCKAGLQKNAASKKPVSSVSDWHRAWNHRLHVAIWIAWDEQALYSEWAVTTDTLISPPRSMLKFATWKSVKPYMDARVHARSGSDLCQYKRYANRLSSYDTTSHHLDLLARLMRVEFPPPQQEYTYTCMSQSACYVYIVFCAVRHFETIFARQCDAKIFELGWTAIASQSCSRVTHPGTAVAS